jgi:hypothetical protein
MDITSIAASQNEREVISGPVALASVLTGLQPDGWIVEPWHVLLCALRGTDKVTISGRLPTGVGDRCPLIATINGEPHTRYFDDGALVTWSIELAIPADSIIDLMIHSPRFVVPRGDAVDTRRLRFGLERVVFQPDVWSTVITGPVTRTTHASGLWDDGWCGSPINLQVEARQPIAAISIGGSVGGNRIEQLRLRATTVVGDEGTDPVQHTLVLEPGSGAFRWTLPADAPRAQLMHLSITSEETFVASPSDGRLVSFLLHDVTFLPRMDFPAGEGGIVLSTVLLSYQRPELLRITLESYLNTVSVPFELIVVDNASDDETRTVIAEFVERGPFIRSIMLDENKGGESLNIGIREARGAFIHISENDLEYLPGWDQILLTKLMLFPLVGQLSLSGSGSHPISRWSVAGFNIHLATHNIMTPSVSPRELYFERGVRWATRGIAPFLIPEDGGFSARVKEQGLYVAWNDRDLVINHGFSSQEFVRRVDYYVANYLSKPEAEGGLKLVDKMLRSAGYRLDQDDEGNWVARRLEEDNTDVPDGHRPSEPSSTA